MSFEAITTISDAENRARQIKADAQAAAAAAVEAAQAEALNGLMLMERRHGGETARYREALARVMDDCRAATHDRRQPWGTAR